MIDRTFIDTLDNTSIQPIWNMSWCNPSHDLKLARDALIPVLQDCNLEIAHFILTLQDQSGFSWVDHFHYSAIKRYEFSQDDTDNLVDYLFSIEPSSVAVKQIVVLGIVLEQGNRIGAWKIPLPPHPFLIHPESNPWANNPLKTAKYGRLYVNAVTKSLELGYFLSDQAIIGRILVAAVTRGGLLQRNALEAFLKQMGQPIHVINNISSIDISLRYRGQDDQEHRRWFIDPLTESLLLQSSLTNLESNSEPWPFIKTFFQECGLKGAVMPKTITKFLKCVSDDIGQKITPFLTQYATRRNTSHSLTHDTWLRLNNLSSTNHTTEVYDIEVLSESGEENPKTFGHSVWSQPIREALRCNKKSDALSKLKIITSQQSSDTLFKYISEFAIHLIQHGSFFQKELTIGTIQNYVSRLAIRLYGVVSHIDMITLNIEAFEDIYTQILEEEAGSKRTISRILREFHNYLSLTYEVPKIENSVLGIGNSLCPVDANIINLEELLATNTALEKSDLYLIHQDLNTIAKLMTYLAFFCGFRRSEILKLRLIDIQGNYEPEILVCPHASRRLKTRSSERRIPIHGLLPHQALKAFMKWVYKRRKQESHTKYSEYVFSVPERNYAFVPEEVIFPAIHQALRFATGDERLRFHSLRHSCASWTLLRLLISEQGAPKLFFESMPKTALWLVKSARLIQTLYGSNQPTRKHLYHITAMLGHANPSVTLEHYIHWCDIMLNHSLEKALNPIDKKVWLRLSNLPSTTTYRLLKQGGALEIQKKLRKQYLDKIIEFKNKKNKPQKIAASKTNLSYLLLMRTWKLLYLHSNNAIPLDILAERYAFTEYEAKNIVHTTKELLAKNLASNKPKFRMMVSKEGYGLLCPRRPTTHQGKLLAEDFSLKLQKLRANPSTKQDYEFLIKYYQKNARHVPNEVMFKDANHAQRFYQILQGIGIAKKHIYLTWHHGKDIKELNNTKRRKYWRNALKLSKNQKLHSKRINHRPFGKYGKLSIRILDYLNDSSAITQSTEAFRFVFIMQLITGYD